MTYDGLVLAAVTAELKAALVGARIQKIKQPEPTDVILLAHRPGADYRLLLSVDSRFPRVYLTSTVPSGPQTPPNFCMALRKYIEGAFVTSIEQEGFDRILRMRIEAPDGNRTTLIHEIMGKHSNLVLIADTGKILAAAKVIPASVSRERQIIPGRDYVPPPGGTKANVLNTGKERFFELYEQWISEAPEPGPWEVAARGWLMSTFSGFGPLLAAELVSRATASGGQSGNDLWAQVTWLQELVGKSNYDPVAITDARGRISVAYPIALLHQPSDSQHPRANYHELLDAHYRSAISSSDMDAELGALLGGVDRAIKSRIASLETLNKAIADTDKAERFKELGELIMGNMSAIPKGADSVLLTDYYSPELAEIKIDLDASLTPKENAERYFKRYRKARDGGLAAVDRIGEIQSETALLQRTRLQIDKAETVEQLRKIRDILAKQQLLRSEQIHERGGKQAAPLFEGFRVKRVMSPDGWEILVGENSQANDYLTTKVATPNDYWFHARSIRGSHVIVRTHNRPQSVPPAVLRQAAELAASGSQAKHSSLVPVDYTLRKFVRKPRGAAVGLVRYQNEKTIDVVPVS